MKWANQHWHEDPLEKRDESKILDAIKILHNDGAFSYKTIDNRVLLVAKEHYFELKRKRIPSESAKIQIPINEIKPENPLLAEIITSIITKNQDKHKYDYYDVLIENIKNYSGPNKELQINCPLFFKLLCNILNDRFADWHTKMMICSAIAYFVLEMDAIPDRAENGYIDDLFIASFVLKEIKDNSPELIDENWLYEENIFETIDNVYQETSDLLGDLTYDILRKVGLQKFRTLELEEYSGSYPQKLSKISSEKRELLGIVVFLINKLYNKKLKVTTVEHIKNMIKECGESDEINRLLELSKIHHHYCVEKKTEEGDDFKDILERRLREARLNALLGK